MSPKFEEHWFELEGESKGLKLRLRRYLGERGKALPALDARPAVLLLHGGNSASETFLMPNGGLCRYLHDAGKDVWLLDWRGSPHIVDRLVEDQPPLGGSVRAERKLFTLDHVIEEDLPAGLGELRRRLAPGRTLSVLGHCFAGGALGAGIARGVLERFEVDAFVLSTMGLFYEVPWNGWMKAEDFIIERVLHHDPECRAVSPKKPRAWPRDVATAFARYPRAWLPPASALGGEMLRCLTFMFGQPYTPDALHPSIGARQLESQFGYMHLGLYQHAGQLVRRGYSARFDAPDVIDRPRAPRARGAFPALPGSDLIPDHFSGKRITLLCAADNQLWHRDSIDLMHEWLRGIDGSRGRVKVRKHVFPGYRIQDLYWGRDAEREVYPKIAGSLA
jgi:hypothetical protein